nr:hypothetical protein [Tanacetum cinerariifolium]
MVIGLEPRVKSCTRSSNEVIFCTIKGKPLALSWGRTPRLHSGVRVRVSRSGTLTRQESACDRDLQMLIPFRGCLLVCGSITDIRSILTQRALTIFYETYHILDEVHPQLPSPNETIHEMPSGNIGVYASLYYTLDEDAYPEFLGDNDEEMDLLSFIRTADPTKVRVAERQRVENEPRLLESTVGGASGDGQGTNIQPVAATTDIIVKDVAPLQSRRQRKRKTVVADASGPSHPPKKLREDYGALGGASTAGKSMSAVQSLFTGAVLNVEARGEPILTLPFVTSSVSATPEREDKSPADFATGLNLRTIGAPQRFVISSDSSHHPTMTAAIDADATAARAPVAPSFDFLIGGIRTVVDPDSDLQKVYVLRWSATNGFGLDDNRICREMLDEFAPLKFFASVRVMDHDQLFIEFNVGAARQISLNVEVRMRAEYNIREKRKLGAVFDEQAKLLKVKDGEIESLKAQLLLKEAEATEAIRLQTKVFKFEAAEQSLWASVKVREQEVANLDAQVTAVKLQNDNLADQVHELEISSAWLQEKVAAFEDFIGQLKKFQDKKMEEVNEKFNKLWAAISKAVKKGMQEGLSAGITHDVEGRKLVDVAAYNPSAEADYLSALQRLQNVNFSLIAELKSHKDAIVDTIMNLLRLDDALAERLGLTESQPHANQLMVPIHHSPDQRVSEPLSAVALEGTEGTSGSTHDTTTTLFVTFVSASTIPPISTDDYEVAHADGQGVRACLRLSHGLLRCSGRQSLLDESWCIEPWHCNILPFWLCSLLPELRLVLSFSSKRSKLMPKASLFLTMSTSAVLKVGMPISAGITASAP